MTVVPPAKPAPLQHVESSVFSQAGYDPQARTLTVRFKSGKTFRYRDVQLERGEAFMGAASKGSYFASQIKPHHDGEEVF